MEFNVSNFKSILKKATLNFSIESVQLKFNKDVIKSNMISAHRDAITELNMPNNVFAMKKDDEYEFNFNQPNVNLMPFLNLVDEESAEISIKNEKIIISSGKQKSHIYFCSPEIVSTFESKPKSSISYFVQLQMNEDVLESFNKIKKIGTKFGNIYFNVENNIFNIETSDRSNMFSNSLKLDLLEDIEYKNITLKFDYKNFINLLNVMNSEYEDFMLSFSYIEKDEMGMLLAFDKDECQKYYLMSSRMEGEI